MSEDHKNSSPKLSKIEREALRVARDPVLKSMLEQERVESEEVDWTLLFRLLGYLRRQQALTLVCVLMSLVEALLLALPAYAIGMAVDVVLRRSSARDEGLLDALVLGIVDALRGPIGSLGVEGDVRLAIFAFGGAILSFWLLRWVLQVATGYLMQMLGQRVVHDLRLDVYHHLTSMDLGYFHANPVGRLVNRTTFDTQTLSQFFSDAFAQGLRDVMFILVLMTVMFTLDVPLTTILLAAFPLLVMAGSVFRRVARPALRTLQAVQSRMNAWLAENIAGMRENQLYGLETRRRAEFHALTDAHQASVRRVIQAWGVLRPMMLGISALATAIILWFGYSRALSGAISVGILLTFLQYTTRLWVPVRNLTEKLNLIQTALTAAERIFDVLETDSGMVNGPEAQSEHIVEKGSICFEDVRFQYPNTTEEVLHGIDFEVQSGEMLALVGDTGAGKSTIVHLISRFYDTTHGRVLVDGADVRHYMLRNLRAGVALVPQDVTIFAGTIRENITLGLEVDDEVLWECIRAVCADRFIERYSDGLEHVMDEGGRTLSAGERQLLSFARALVFNPPVLILDEATANVDTETETLIQEALERLTKGRTSVVIAHRLSTIRTADQILVLRHGQVIERGRHEELLAHGGEYERLHRLHMGGMAA